MVKNEFLPFGTAANANVLPNADYQVLPARSAGFSSGVAKSEELNTVWRQGSTMASVLAQFIADQSGQDVLDNGDLATLQTNLQNAIKEFSQNNVQSGLARFEASGSFTVPAGITTLYITGCAGGGGGGGGGGSEAGGYGGSGGGGGAGQSVVKKAITVTSGQSYAITVGAAGQGGVGGTNAGTNGQNGTSGGASSFGSLLTLNGGSAGGLGGGSQLSGGGGIGGGIGGGDGSDGGSRGGVGGMGGSGPLGTAGGSGRSGNTSGKDAHVGWGFGTGGGGGGGGYDFAAAGGKGSNGMPGLIIIEW